MHPITNWLQLWYIQLYVHLKFGSQPVDSITRHAMDPLLYQPKRSVPPYWSPLDSAVYSCIGTLGSMTLGLPLLTTRGPSHGIYGGVSLRASPAPTEMGKPVGWELPQWSWLLRVRLAPEYQRFTGDSSTPLVSSSNDPRVNQEFRLSPQVSLPRTSSSPWQWTCALNFIHRCVQSSHLAPLRGPRS